MKLSDKLLSFYLHQAFEFGFTEPFDSYHYVSECVVNGSVSWSDRISSLTSCVDLVSLYCWYQSEDGLPYYDNFVEFVDSQSQLRSVWELPF